MSAAARVATPGTAGEGFHDPREVPDQARLRRELARWEGLESGSRLGEIVVLEHGGRSRPVIHRGSRHLRSRIVSRKTRRLQITEGKALRFLALTCEASASCLDWQAHPFRIRVTADGVAWTWYVDLVRSVAGSAPELIEVKRTVRDLDDPELERKYQVMGEFARRIGWRFRILYSADVFGANDVRDDRARNVHEVHGARFLRLDAAEARAIGSIAAAGGASWAAARETVSPGDRRRGDEVLLCACARGTLAFDFDAPRNGSTPLSTVRAGAPTFRI